MDQSETLCKAMFHLVNNREFENNSRKMTKVTPIYDTLKSALIQYVFFHAFLSVDESMVPYYGRHRGRLVLVSLHFTGILKYEVCEI